MVFSVGGRGRGRICSYATVLMSMCWVCTSLAITSLLNILLLKMNIDCVAKFACR